MSNYKFYRFKRFQFFIEKLIKKNERKFNIILFSNNYKFNLKPIFYRFFFFQLLNDKVLYKSYLNTGKLYTNNIFNNLYFKDIFFKKSFSISIIVSVLKNLTKFFEFTFFFYFLYQRIILFAFKKKYYTCDLLVFVNKKKHFDYVNSILRYSKIKYRFLILSNNQKKNFLIKNKNLLYFSLPNFFNINFSPFSNAYFQFYYKFFFISVCLLV